MVSSTPQPHFTSGKEPVTIFQEAGWAPGPVWRGGKSRPHRNSIPDHPACSQSLHQLSYPAHSMDIPLYYKQWNPRLSLQNKFSEDELRENEETLLTSREFRIGYFIMNCPVTWNRISRENNRALEAQRGFNNVEPAQNLRSADP